MDPPKRERKRVVNYAENEFYRQALKAGGGGRGGGGGLRLPKMPALQDFQFFAVPRLTEIFERESAAELHKHALAQKEAAARAQVHNVGFSYGSLSFPARLFFLHGYCSRFWDVACERV